MATPILRQLSPVLRGKWENSVKRATSKYMNSRSHLLCKDCYSKEILVQSIFWAKSTAVLWTFPPNVILAQFHYTSLLPVVCIQEQVRVHMFSWLLTSNVWAATHSLKGLILKPSQSSIQWYSTLDCLPPSHYRPLSRCGHLDFTPFQLTITKQRLDELIVWYHVHAMNISIHYHGNREHDQDGDSVIKVSLVPLCSLHSVRMKQAIGTSEETMLYEAGSKWSTTVNHWVTSPRSSQNSQPLVTHGAHPSLLQKVHKTHHWFNAILALHIPHVRIQEAWLKNPHSSFSLASETSLVSLEWPSATCNLIWRPSSGTWRIKRRIKCSSSHNPPKVTGFFFQPCHASGTLYHLILGLVFPTKFKSLLKTYLMSQVFKD